jgi:NAD(P)-dependent dehydrogenase (short-subunit alcohol dehydrogenase family)
MYRVEEAIGMDGLDGKVALVTGAGSGIGRASAAALAKAGAKVVATDVDLAAAKETAEAIGAAGGIADPVDLDVADEASWGRAIGWTERRHGALHILVNNAGICIRVALAEMDLATWRRQNAVNLDGVFLGVKAAAPLMTASGGGAIVNISSVAGLQGVPGLAGYCASKGGVRLFTKAAALEFAAARNNIRVNSIHPGAIETPIWVKMANNGVMVEKANSAEEIMRETRDISARVTPMGHAGAPEDIAAGVVYLCSDAAKFVTGSELVIDGGVFAG